MIISARKHKSTRKYISLVDDLPFWFGVEVEKSAETQYKILDEITDRHLDVLGVEDCSVEGGE